MSTKSNSTLETLRQKLITMSGQTLEQLEEDAWSLLAYAAVEVARGKKICAVDENDHIERTLTTPTLAEIAQRYERDKSAASGYAVRRKPLN